MLLTENFLQVIDTYTKAFRYLWQFPIYFNTKAVRFQSVSKSHRVIWCVGSFTAMSLSFIMCIPPLLHSLFISDGSLSFLNIFMAIFVLILSTYGLLLTAGIWTSGSLLISATNELICQLEFMKQENEYQQSKARQEKEWTLLIMKSVMVVYGLTPFIFAPFFIAMNADPGYTTFKLLLTTSNILQNQGYFIIAIRYCLVVFCCTEGSRMFAAGIIYFILRLYLYIDCFTLLEKISKRFGAKGAAVKTKGCINMFSRISINSLQCSVIDALVNGAFMAIGFALCIVFNVATIKFRNIIPMPFYGFFPVFAILTPIVLSVIFPVMVESCNKSSKQIWTWNLKTAHSEQKRYLLKKLRSLRPLTLYIGINGFNFFSLAYSTKANYYSSILDYTITAILSE